MDGIPTRTVQVNGRYVKLFIQSLLYLLSLKREQDYLKKSYEGHTSLE